MVVWEIIIFIIIQSLITIKNKYQKYIKCFSIILISSILAESPKWETAILTIYYFLGQFLIFKISKYLTFYYFNEHSIIYIFRYNPNILNSRWIPQMRNRYFNHIPIFYGSFSYLKSAEHSIFIYFSEHSIYFYYII